MTREELILELIVQLIQIEGRSGDMNYIRGVANFILSRENLLLEKIGRPLKAWESLFKNWEGDIQVRGLPAQIECGTCIEKTKEALAIIEKEGGE
jgi:hypothetical protein